MTIRTEVQNALSDVYSGASMTEASALIDKLADRGLVIVQAFVLLAYEQEFGDDVHAGIDEDRELPELHVYVTTHLDDGRNEQPDPREIDDARQAEGRDDWFDPEDDFR